MATIITALAALATSIASFVMILEMKRQRTVISKPVIKIISEYFNAKVCKNSWEWENLDSHQLKLKLFNFGTGPAINIKVKWEIDKEELKRVLKHFDPYNQFKVEWNKVGFGGQNTFELGGATHIVENQINQKIEALPIYNGENSYELIVPSFYKYAFERYVEFAHLNRPKEENFSKFEPPDYPTINATFKYEDISGGKFEKDVTIGLEVYAITPIKKVSSVKGNNEHAVFCNIEIIEKSV